MNKINNTHTNILSEKTNFIANTTCDISLRLRKILENKENLSEEQEELINQCINDISYIHNIILCGVL